MQTLPGYKDFRTENGSSQGQNLALTGLCVPSSLDSGWLHLARRPQHVNHDQMPVVAETLSPYRDALPSWLRVEG